MQGVPYQDSMDRRIVLAVGQVFDSMSHFRFILYDYAVQEGIELEKMKNEKRRITMKCEFEKCPF